MARDCILLAKLGLAALILALPGSASAQFTNCNTRHFYNDSTVPFMISLNSSTGTCSYNSRNQLRCTIPPGQVGEIHYKDRIAPSRKPLRNEPQLTVKSLDGGRLYNKSFSVDTQKCYINHSGNTGNIVVNEPADGDIFTCGRRYSCR